MYPYFKKLLFITQKYSILILLALVCFLFFYFHLYHYFTLSSLKFYQAGIQTWTNDHKVAAVLIYNVAFTLMIACAIPCATFLTLLGGFLFGLIAIAYASFCVTFGGMIL